MKLDEIYDLGLDRLCELYDAEGPSGEISEDDLLGAILPNDVSKGKKAVILRKFNERAFIHRDGGKYSIYASVYEDWLEAKESQAEKDAEDTRWQPVLMENFEELAKKSVEAAVALSEANEYKAKRKPEADHAIGVLKNLSKTLLDNDGSAMREQFDSCLTLMERVLTFFEQGDRIWKIIKRIIAIILALLG